MEKFIAYDAYQRMADAYSARVDTKPYNAYLERPAMFDLIGDVSGLNILDIGCGPGKYHQTYLENGAGDITSFDASPRMLENARQRLGSDANLMLLDLRESLPFPDNHFDLAVAPLVMDYIEEWIPVFQEIRRILKLGGRFVFSSEHPFTKVRFSKTGLYFEREYLEIEWRGFGAPLLVPTYRRSLTEMTESLSQSGLTIERIVETRPTERFRETSPEEFEKLQKKTSFICFSARKGY